MFKKYTSTALSRRDFFGTAAGSIVALSASQAAAAGPTDGEAFSYEITRTEEEWKARLSKDEYVILRKGSTELPKTSPLWEEERAGWYHCKGCELAAYEGRWKVVLDKGWAFFKHSEPNAVLTAIDGPVVEYGAMADGPGAFMEVHCRRCSSHLGHLLIVEGQMLHCINGTALNFYPDAA